MIHATTYLDAEKFCCRAVREECGGLSLLFIGALTQPLLATTTKSGGQELITSSLVDACDLPRLLLLRHILSLLFRLGPN